MGGFFGLLTSWLLGAFARLFTFMSANFLATKIILGTLFIIILPIILNNVIYSLMSIVFDAAASYAGEHEPGLETTIQFAGLAGYMVTELGLVDAFTVVLSAMGIRFALAWIPFVGPK